MKLSSVCFAIVASCLCLLNSFGQSTEFSYQGQLRNSDSVANGVFDFEFSLYSSAVGGAPISATLARDGVNVTNGVFSVSLDFGSTFDGSPRFLEIRIRQSGAGAFTTLSPRQNFASSPYAVRSLDAQNAVNALNAASATNSTQLGGIAANQYLQTNGNGSGLTNLNASNITTGTLANARLGQIPTANIADGAVTASKVPFGQVVKSVNSLTDNVTLAGSSSIAITPSGNTLTFSTTAAGVGGSGTVNTIPMWSGNATTLGNSVISQTAAGNVGINVSIPLAKLHIDATSAGHGLIVSSSAGGAVSGRSNSNKGVEGLSGSDLGVYGQSESNFGVYGRSHTSTGVFGFGATGVEGSSEPGGIAMKATGPFLGTGGATITGINNDGAVVTARRSGGNSFVIVDSSPAGQNSVLAFRKNNLNRWLILADDSPESGVEAGSNFKIDRYNDAGSGITTSLFIARNNGFVGIDTAAPTRTLDVNGLVRVRSLLLNSSAEHVCISATGTLSVCGASSLRLKNNIHNYTDGLNILRQLRPISYNWKDGGAYDIGLGAEDVATVAPFFAVRNKEGVVEGVKYERLTMVLINAVNQQQKQIEQIREHQLAIGGQKTLMERQQRLIEALEKRLSALEKTRRPKRKLRRY